MLGVEGVCSHQSLEIRLLEPIPENNSLQFERSDSESSDELHCTNLNKKIATVATAFIFFGVGSFDVCVYGVPGLSRSPDDTIHSPHMTPLQLNLSKYSYLAAGGVLVTAGLMTLSTLCMDEVPDRFKKTIILSAFVGAFFELAPIIVMFA